MTRTYCSYPPLLWEKHVYDLWQLLSITNLWMHLFGSIFCVMCSWIGGSHPGKFQVDPENSHSLKEDPASYTHILNAASRGLHRYASEYYVWDVPSLLLGQLSSFYSEDGLSDFFFHWLHFFLIKLVWICMLESDMELLYSKWSSFSLHFFMK